MLFEFKQAFFDHLSSHGKSIVTIDWVNLLT